MKLNLKIIITLSFVIFCFMQGKSQSYIKSFPQYIDKYVTDKMIDSLRTRQISNFIIYQTNISDKIVIDTLLSKNDTILVSYLIWKENDKINCFILTDTCVYRYISEIEDYTNLFSYPYFSYLWITQDEVSAEIINNKLIRITPSINIPYGKNTVVYITDNYKRFFEFGENVYYQLKPSRNKHRQEYISLLNSVVSQFNNKWKKVFKNEKRWWGEDNW